MPLSSVNHSRDDSLPVPVPDPSIDSRPRASSSSTSPATDPPAYPPSFTGSVVGSISRRNRRSFAALAHKTSTALASLSTISQTATTTALRPSASSSSLSKHAKVASASPLTPPLSDGDTNEQLPDFSRPASPAVADSTPALKRRLTLQRIPTPPQEPRSAPTGAAPVAPNMHQTSSRLLRMTEDERPFTKVGLSQSWVPRLE